MAPTLFEPKIGDLIEIFRIGYQHWAVYIGDGYVIHLAPATKRAGGGANSMSVRSYKAVIKKEKLSSILGWIWHNWKINNILDKKYEPRPARDIQRDAESVTDQEIDYCLIRRNCEHFATFLRYGKAESAQVKNLMGLLFDEDF